MTERTTKLIVDAGHPAVRIEVLDANYQVQAKGYGKIEQELPTGFYTLQYKAADAIERRDITLRPDSPLSIEKPPELRFTSAAPLSITSTSHEYHQEHAIRLSHEEPLELGQGSRIFVFVRDVDPGGRTHPARRLSLHTLAGELVVDFDKVIETSHRKGLARFGGRNIAVDPGFYRLRLTLRKGRAIEMMVPACPNWQSQVFLLRQGGSNEYAGHSILDLPNATQLMAKPYEGFDPHRYPRQKVRINPSEAGEDLRLIDLALQALAKGYRGIRAKDLKDMLWGKWHDPLLGILGLHLLLRQDEPDLQFAKRIVRRLQHSIMGDFRHPDVDALAVKIAKLAGEPIQIPRIEAPPMLRQSWNILVQATAETPRLIPFGSLASQIAERVWGMSSWLIWEVPADSGNAHLVSEISGRAPRSGRSRRGGSIKMMETMGGAEIPSAMEHRYDAKDEGLEWIAHSTNDSAALKVDIEQGQSGFSVVDLAGKLTSETPFTDADFRTVWAALEKTLNQGNLLTAKGRKKIIREVNLNQTEFALLMYFQSQGYLQKHTYVPSREPVSLEALVSQLGVPNQTVMAGLVSLYAKLAAMQVGA